MIRCDAVKPEYVLTDVPYCKRPATWVAKWNAGQGRIWYCRYHVASRKRDPALTDWKRLGKSEA